MFLFYYSINISSLIKGEGIAPPYLLKVQSIPRVISDSAQIHTYRASV